MLAAAPHTVYHLVSSSSHPRLPGHFVFLEAFSAPSSPHQHPWGFSFIAQNSISYLRPMKITVQHQSPCSSFISSLSPSQSPLPLYDLSSDVTCRYSRQLGYVFGGESARVGTPFSVVVFVCVYACLLVGSHCEQMGTGIILPVIGTQRLN